MSDHDLSTKEAPKAVEPKNNDIQAHQAAAETPKPQVNFTEKEKFDIQQDNLQKSRGDAFGRG